MRIIKPNNWKKFEIAAMLAVLFIIIVNALISKDSPVAVISAICGITYTVLAGKGNPICYLFGVTGSGFYSYLAFVNALWGNLVLYMGYYIPMQTLGFFQWRKNLRQDKYEIIKTSLNNRERIRLVIITLLASCALISALMYFNDKSPYIDGVTTVFSVAGMYLTVKRCIEQWVVWMVVNGLSLIMWLNIALSGEKVYSTVIMWAVYFILAVYFYIAWRKEVKNPPDCLL